MKKIKQLKAHNWQEILIMTNLMQKEVKMKKQLDLKVFGLLKSWVLIKF